MISRPCAILFVAALALTRPATATPPPTETAATESDARSKFNEAVRLFKAGEVARALPLFEELASTTGSPNAELYVGHCLKHLERWRDAHVAFSAVAAEPRGTEDQKYEATREAARAELEALEARVAKLVVNWAEAPESFSLRLDGVEVDPHRFGSEWVLEPGSHRVEARGRDVEPISRTVAIEAGELKTISLSFVHVARPAAHESGTGAESPSRREKLRTLGFVAGGVGVAGVAVWTVFGLQAKADYDALERECPEGCANEKSRERIDSGKSSQTIANVGLAVGGVGLAASGALLYLAFSEDETPRASVALSPGSASLSYEGRF